MKLDKEEIKKIIPYDDPFLWVDEVESIDGDNIIAFKHTSSQDPYFKGHFTDLAIMPGVLVVEGLAQTGSLLLREKIGKGHKSSHFLAYQVKSAQFLKPIFPGDTIRYEVELLGFYNSKIANLKGNAFVEGEKKM